MAAPNAPQPADTPVISLPALSLASLKAVRVDLVLAAVFLVVGAVPRLVLLGDIPPGLHGDEAGFGLEARRILEEGNIGAWSGVALGTPTGAFYWTALIFDLFGDTRFTLRLSYALLGIATVPLAYLAFRVMFGRSVAVIGALLLGASAWHIHYSRVAHVPVAWVLVEVALMLVLFLALQRESRWLFGIAGGIFAAGIYTYGGYPVFVLAIVIFLAWLAVTRYRQRLVPFVAWIGVMAGAALLVGLPMASYVLDHRTDYIERNRARSITEAPEYQAADNAFERAHVLFNREVDFLQLVVTDPDTDGVDGAGVFPLVSWALVALLVPGGVICFLRWRNPAHAFLLIGTIVLALTPVLTTEAEYRRTVGLTPFLAAIAALPLAALWDWGRRERLLLAVPAGAAVALAVGTTSAIDLTRYFSAYDDDPFVNFVYVADLVDATEYVDRLHGHPYVYFYAPRWSFNYEPVQFLLPESTGEDRSREYGTFLLTADRSRDVVFVFLPPYLEDALLVRRNYPDGELYEDFGPNGDMEFRGYYLPRSETAVLEPGAPTPTAAPVAATATQEEALSKEQRDEQRMRDLSAIAEALEAYHRRHGTYPDNDSGIQTLCAFPDFDVGCELADVLDPIPQDPLRSSGGEDYWYSGDNTVFIVYAVRESDAYPECEDHPDHLGDIDSLICVRGPPPATTPAR